MIFVYLIFYYIFLFIYGVTYLSIGDIEISLLEGDSFISFITNILFDLFGKNDFTLRLPSFIFSIMTITLYFYVSNKVLKNRKDVYISIVLFTLLPGFIISTILVNKSIYLMFLTLYFVYLFLYRRFLSYIILACFVFLDYSFIVLYFGLFFYAMYKKQNLLVIYSLILFMFNANYFNYSIGGVPKGEFLNLFVVYSSIFSPILFVYFIYSLYKYLVKNKKNILWFISFFAFVTSIILSFRQRIRIDDFAPFVILSSIFMVKTFFESYRVRLRIFRKPYKFIFSFILFSLLFFDFLLLNNKLLYIFYDNPKKHIMYTFHDTKEIKTILNNNQINNIYCENKLLCKQLYFYGINSGDEYYITEHNNNNAKKVSIFHTNKETKTIFVSKVHIEQ
jgi:hypothetical protein